MNNLQLLLLLLLLQNNSGRHPGHSTPLLGNPGSRYQGAGNISGLNLSNATYMISNLRRTLDTVERMSQMTSMIQNMPAKLTSALSELPALSSPQNDSFSSDLDHPDEQSQNQAQTPDLNQLIQTLGPMLQMLGNNDK